MHEFEEFRSGPAGLEGALGRPLRRFATTDSSNERLWEFAREGAPHGACCVAASQIAGRGRQGRTWLSPEGGLYASILLRSKLGASQLAPFALGVAVAAAQAIESLSPASVRLKWPNDLWVDGRKLGGILLESRSSAAGSLVVGLGLNVVTPDDKWPEEIQATALDEWGSAPSLDELLVELLNRLDASFEEFIRDGVSSFAYEWKQRDVLVGRKLRVELGNHTILGRADGIDEQGRLLLRDQAGGLHEVVAGEAHLDLESH